jgi:phosphatidylinositol alpha-1,6-mannosyltransferase
MERLNQHVCQELMKDFDVQVCGPQGGERHLPRGIGYTGSPALPLGRFLIHNTWQAVRQSHAFKPQVIYAGSGLVTPAAQLAGRIAGASVVAYLHGLDIVANHPLYRAIFLPCIRACDGFLVNSQNTKRLAETHRIAGERIMVLHPGVEMPTLTDRETKAAGFRNRLDAGNRPILLSVGRLTPRKGIVEFIEHSLPIIIQQVPDLLYAIIGEEPYQSAAGHKTGIADRIRTVTGQMGLTEHVQLLGRVDDEELACAYFASQLHVFPVLGMPRDVEGFGMVAIEAAAHGLPTIAFATGGVPDAVAEGISGELIEANRYDIMAERIAYHLMDGSASMTSQQCIEFSSTFRWEHFGVALRDYFHSKIGS